ncbi:MULTISPECIES: hypothetical protein [Halanaerobium]|jgi:hypothetical protein|uniref:Uncharacterized protein n=1 Tax=Halanaerobium kushneri TaxID=56779 RepID=A0A1N6SV09_9FIRM|nr:MULTISPECIES: hypothetical protein [Halanaerobium]RCW60906.1 hypothetical protein DFR80_10665 [Halanaerobium sp. ST460_2HS_T2]SIQ44948.1 hypothetical protein SAMN05421834_104153 [Halanaerobium kushneri]
MLINLSTTIALSCPACGRLEKEKVNIFELPAGELKQLSCSCGAEKAALMRKENSQLQINYFCLHCDKAHKVLVSAQDFWRSNHLQPLSCRDTGLNPGFFGPPALVNEEIKKEKQDLELMAAELGFDDFKNPEVMLQALDIIHDIAVEEALSCECGSDDINIELFSDRIQLICNNCGSRLNIAAVDKEDLKNLRQLNSVQLHSIQGKSNNF